MLQYCHKGFMHAVRFVHVWSRQFTQHQDSFFLKYSPYSFSYQPPASSTFLSEQISHQQPANRTNQPSATNQQ
jgi:hypothetical protein